MEFARVADQAKELWARPAGRWLLGGAALFLVMAALVSYLFSRPAYESLGTFDPADAVKVSQRLAEAKVPYRQTGAGYSFRVPASRLAEARLLLAELELDPTSTVWAAESWKERVSWSNTDFDKRRLWVEQTEANLVRSIRALAVVENARVQISVPMERPLYKEQERPPRASVMVYPRQGRDLSLPVVEAIMQYVAHAVEGMAPTDVVVVDAARSRIVSEAAFQPESETAGAGAAVSSLMEVEQQFQLQLQQQLRTELERVVGVGNVAVIVKPTINWDRVRVEAEEYHGAGPGSKGVPISEQVTRRSTESAPSPSGLSPSGTTPNAEWGVPTYPGAAAEGGSLSEEEYSNIVNYLVNQTRTITDRPGGAIEEISVGLLVNQTRIDPGQEQAMKLVVAMAMGSKARVEVAAVPFAPSPWETDREAPVAVGGPQNWLYPLLAAMLSLVGAGLFFLVSRPRRPVLEPVFAGPQTAMMGGIPVTELEWAAAAQGPEGRAPHAAEGKDPQVRKAEEPQAVEMDLGGDQFLQLLGIDPEKQKMREKVERIARTNPEAVAGLLKTWISEG